jgi:hypothetical protein
MMQRPVDKWAFDIPKNSGLAPCLYVPIAARDGAAIEQYVGTIERAVISGVREEVFLVCSHTPPECDLPLRLWEHANAGVLRCEKQVWVHVDFRGYRKAYRNALPEEDLTNLVVDHVLNRRVARVKGFSYVRLVPITRGANSSSGGLCEKWQLEYHSSDRMREINAASRAMVQYADLSDLVKMLDMKTGNSLMDAVNEAQFLVDLPGGKSATLELRPRLAYWT